MPEPVHAGVSGLADDLRSAWSEVSQMLALRRELVESELRSDLTAARRFAIVATLCAVLAVVGLAVFAVAGAAYADRRYGFEVPWISLSTGGLLLALGLLGALVSWFRFRRSLLLLEQSRAELKEDLLWLEEWLGRADEDPSDI